MYAPPEPNEEEDNDEQGVVFTDVEELLGTTEGQFSLPPHFSTGYIARGRQLLLWALLPTLETLMSRTLALQNGLSRMTANLPGVIVQAIRTRFAP
ncbi:hypothetical protein KUCAC02_017093, partial [Chaenocephalus aceratus]